MNRIEKKPVMLVIDDEAVVRASIIKIFKRNDYLILEAANGKEGLAVLEKENIDIVILDLNMPEMDGLEFLSILKTNESDDYSVIVLTNSDVTEEIRFCYESGVRYFINKPVNMYKLRGIVQSQLKTLDYKKKLQKTVIDLKAALAKVKTLEGILPICSFCKRIRDEQGNWIEVEKYVHDHSQADFSHGLCPACFKKHYPDIYAKRLENAKNSENKLLKEKK